MFVRRKVNKSGSISISVVDKSRGRYEVIKSFGAAKTAAEADLLENRAREYVRDRTGEPEALFGGMSEAQLREYASTLDRGRIELAGPELLYGAVFDRLELGKGQEALFRHLVITRAFLSGSLLRTGGYLKRYLGQSCGPEAIFRLVDGLYLTGFRVSHAAPSAALLLPSPLPGNRLCLLLDAEGRPVAARLLESKGRSRDRFDAPVQRLARKYGTVEPIGLIHDPQRVQAVAPLLRISRKDAAFKPLLRRRRGRAEGFLCVCLAAFAVLVEMERLLSGSGISLSGVREAAATLFRLNYISPYTRRPKSVLVQPTALQRRLLALLQR